MRSSGWTGHWLETRSASILLRFLERCIAFTCDPQNSWYQTSSVQGQAYTAHLPRERWSQCSTEVFVLERFGGVCEAVAVFMFQGPCRPSLGPGIRSGMPTPVPVRRGRTRRTAATTTCISVQASSWHAFYTARIGSADEAPGLRCAYARNYVITFAALAPSRRGCGGNCR